MGNKRHVLLVISREPIDLGGIHLESQVGVDHLILEELNITGGNNGKWVTEKVAPDQLRIPIGYPFRGYGISISETIVRFLLDMVSSMHYSSFRDRKREATECSSGTGMEVLPENSPT